MGAPVLTVATMVQCVHAGTARAILSNPRVSIDGARVVTVTCNYGVTNCTQSPTNGGPCATGTWTSGAARVTAGGLPVLLQSSTSTCLPTGTPMVVGVGQARVIAE